jgi:putative tributyrin esterase
MPGAAQPAQAARPGVIVRDASFQSVSLGREMKYRIVLPADYETSGVRYPVLYLLHGLMGHYEDWESRTHLDDYVAGLPLIVAMPEGDDSWYTNSASQPQEKWEDYIIKDFVREIDSRYRTIQTRHARAIAGLSMGGYGAMKFALKYPGTFIFAASFSGAQAPVHDPEHKVPFGQKYADQLRAIFGEGMTPTLTANDIYELAKKAAPAQLPYLEVTCGTEDGLLASNREFVALLQQLKIRYEYHESAGAHTWQYWDEQLPHTLSLLMERFFRPPELGLRHAAPAARPSTISHRPSAIGRQPSTIGPYAGLCSRASNSFLRSIPQRYPPMLPSVRTMRWQGMRTATGFEAHALATARTAAGFSMAAAIWA